MTYSPTKLVPARAEGKLACIMPSAAEVRNNIKQKKRPQILSEVFLKKSGDDLLSHKAAEGWFVNASSR